MVGNVGCCGLLQPCCHRHDPQNYIIEGAFEIDYSPRLSLCASGLSLAVRIYSQDNVDPSTGKGKKSENAYITRGKTKTITGMDVPTKVIELKLSFEVARDFGDPGALVVENRDKHEFFLRSASLNYTNRTDPKDRHFRFYCGSWVYPISKTRTKRIFFSNQLYLPQKTPRGLEKLRQKELGKLRGGSKDKRKDERKKWDRIYEYDCYNDLGDPDNGKQHARPILGGSQFPYPRRLRTGRSPCREDLLAESRPVSCSQIYVPLDERLSHEKQEELKNNFVDALVRFLAQESTRTPLFNQECPDFVAKIAHFFVPKGAIPIEDFKFMRSIGDFLGKKPKPSPNQDPRHDDRFGIEDLFADKEVKGLEDSIKQKLQKLVPNKIFEDITTAATKRRSVSSQPPSIIAEDKTQWSDDLEFGRQMLAGTNPVRIHRMKDDDLKLIGREFGKLMEEDDDLRLIWRELGKLVQEDDGLKLILKVLRKLIEKDDDLKHIGEEIGELTEEDDGLKLILGVLGKLIEKNDDLKHIGDDLKHIGEENGEVIEEDFGLYLIVGVLGNLIEKVQMKTSSIYT